MAARMSAERAQREMPFYPQHLEEWQVKQMGYDGPGGMDERNARMKERGRFENYVDKDGAVDFTEYLFDKIRPNSYDNPAEHGNQYQRAQHAHPVQTKVERQKRHNLNAKHGKYRRWETAHTRMNGVRSVGGPGRVSERRQARLLERTKIEVVKVQVPAPYTQLGLPMHASVKQAADHYRKLAKQYHPDAATGDSEKMAEVNAAYVLVKRILREGGPETSRTAREGAHTTTERHVKVRYRAGEEKEKKDSKFSDEALFRAKVGGRLEQVELLHSTYQDTLTPKQHRQFLLEQRTEKKTYYGSEQRSSLQEVNTSWRYLFILCLVCVTVIETLLPESSSFRSPSWNKVDPCAAKVRENVRT